MKVLSFHQNFKLPTKGTQGAGAYDIYMPDSGTAHSWCTAKVPLGFAAEVPVGYVALILPRSGIGFNMGLELNNTCGVIDADYRGEWYASIKTKNIETLHWAAGERILQYLLVPVLDSPPELVLTLSSTRRSTGGLGSTGA